MKYAFLVWSSLTRRKLRTVFTMLSILVAFILYGYLAALNLSFNAGVELAGEDRLVLRHKVSLIQLLPISHEQQIASTPGVVLVGHNTWFGGIYQDPKNFFPQIAVESEPFLQLHPEYRLPEEQKNAWLADRIGAIAGRELANKYGWKVGDRIPIQPTIWRRKDGRPMWEFVLDGIYDGAKEATDTRQFFFHYDYLEESRIIAKGMVGWYVLRINDPPHAAEIADRIDRQFANSLYETKTSTEKAFAASFAKQVGDITTIVAAVLSAVFFTILLVAGNTMMQTVRERITELAVLKTVGYSNGLVLGLVLAESLVLSGLGGGLGLFVAWRLIRRGDPTGILGRFHFAPPDILLGAGLVLLLGLATGAFPAWQAMRLRVVDALRRT